MNRALLFLQVFPFHFLRGLSFEARGDGSGRGAGKTKPTTYTKLCHDDGVFGVDGAVGDPVFLSQRMGRVDDDFVRLLVKNRRCFHLDRVVPVA